MSDPPTITRFYDNAGDVIAEYGTERRVLVSYSEIPDFVIKAFLAAEDRHFFEHQGVDFYGLARAILQNAINIMAAHNRRAVGGSTITQQVVKSFLLGNERTFSRKVKEAVLAYRISKVYSKDRILELYLNQIFFGNNSYGIYAAAQNYFNKELSELTISEAALLASLPKAPSSLILAHATGGARQEALNTLATVWANRSLTDAIAWVRQLPDAEDRSPSRVG